MSFTEAEVREFQGVVNQFHKPGENYKTDLYVVTPKTKELLEVGRWNWDGSDACSGTASPPWDSRCV